MEKISFYDLSMYVLLLRTAGIRYRVIDTKWMKDLWPICIQCDINPILSVKLGRRNITIKKVGKNYPLLEINL